MSKTHSHRKRLTVENVLFFANKKVFNLDVNSHSNYLSGIVSKLVGEGSLVEVARDDADIYYKTTRAGDIKLLRLQLAWRMEHGKDCSEHAARLKELLDETSADTVNQEAWSSHAPLNQRDDAEDF